MISEDTLRRAVELAGWGHAFDPGGELWIEAPEDISPSSPYRSSWTWDELPQALLDALAAALVRLVDAAPDGVLLEIYERRATITKFDLYGMPKVEWHSRCPDRTENTINCIVEFADKNPGVLS